MSVRQLSDRLWGFVESMALPQGALKGSQNSTDSLWPDTPANFGLKRKLSGTRQEHQNDAFVGKPLKKIDSSKISTK